MSRYIGVGGIDRHSANVLAYAILANNCAKLRHGKLMLKDVGVREANDDVI